MIIEKATDDSVKSVNIVFGGEEFLMYSLEPSVFIKDTFTTTSVLVIKGITKVKLSRPSFIHLSSYRTSFEWVNKILNSLLPRIWMVRRSTVGLSLRTAPLYGPQLQMKPLQSTLESCTSRLSLLLTAFNDRTVYLR